MSEGKNNPADQGAGSASDSQGASPSAAAGPSTTAGKTDAAVLTLLVCPVTKSSLDYDAAACELISHAAGLAFPIREGVPIMLVDQARTLDDSE